MECKPTGMLFILNKSEYIPEENLGKTKDYEIGICCFSTKNRNRDNVSV
jgi:hypothetical protein